MAQPHGTGPDDQEAHGAIAAHPVSLCGQIGWQVRRTVAPFAGGVPECRSSFPSGSMRIGAGLAKAAAYGVSTAK